MARLSSTRRAQKIAARLVDRAFFPTTAVLCLLFFCLFSCDQGLGPGPPDTTGIKGTIVFNGAWPPETADVAVAVYQKRPQNLADFFNIAGWDTTVTLGATRYEYDVPLQNAGTYEWVVVAWRPQDGFWNFNSLLGCYHVGNDTLPTPVEVQSGETAKNVDIQAYFSLIAGADLPDREICTGFLPAVPGKPALGGRAGR